MIFQSTATRIGILAFMALFSWVQKGDIPTSALVYMLLLFYNYIPLNRLILRITALEDIDISMLKIQQFLNQSDVEENSNNKKDNNNNISV